LELGISLDIGVWALGLMPWATDNSRSKGSDALTSSGAQSRLSIFGWQFGGWKGENQWPKKR
jgi:hypothetical protein